MFYINTLKNLEYEIKNLKYDVKRINEELNKQYWTIELLMKELGYESYVPNKPLPKEIRKIKK